MDIMMPVTYHHDVRTTLTLDDDIVTKINSEMRRSGKTFKETVNEALRTGLSVQKELKASKSFKVRARSLGTHPGIDYDNIGSLLEQIEGPSHG